MEAHPSRGAEVWCRGYREGLARAAERRQDGPSEDDEARHVTEHVQKAREELQPDVKPAHDADIQPPHRNQIEPVRRGEA